jgi:hypothetical protein
MQLTFLGGIGTVTGSKAVLERGGQRLLDRSRRSS